MKYYLTPHFFRYRSDAPTWEMRGEKGEGVLIDNGEEYPFKEGTKLHSYGYLSLEMARVPERIKGEFKTTI